MADVTQHLQTPSRHRGVQFPAAATRRFSGHHQPAGHRGSLSVAAVFFLIPFFIVFKISLSTTAIAMPPYTR
jgi:hypothetical protein